MPAESEVRLQLFNQLAALPSDRFEALLLALDIPPGLISPSKTRQGDRVTDLLEWVKGSTGCGLETLKIELGKVQTHERTVFEKYRLFVRQDSRYQHVRDLYTETEALIPLEAETVERQSERPEQDVEQAQKKVERFPVLKGLRKYALGNERQHLLLAGRPGSGKSTTLKRLLLEWADEALAESTVIPVYVQLKSDRPIAELICAAFRPAQVRVTPEQLDEWLLQNQLLLLLDGVNEIPSEARRRQLQDFREDNPTTPMIFTTRNLSVGGDLGIAKRLEMRPLSEPQMREFVGKYLTKRGMPDQAETLLRQLKDRLREIAETPLLLKLLCDVFDPETQQIPQSKGELFQQFDRDYEHIKKDRQPVPVSENFWDFKADILQFLAFSMIQTDDPISVEAWYSLSRDRAERLLEKWLRDRVVPDPATKAKLWVKDLCRCHLLQDAKEPGAIEFHHQLFQEYYAAEYLRLRLLRELTDEELKRDYLNLLKWTEPIALMLSLVDKGEQALRVVRLAINEVDLMLGARLAGEVHLPFQSITTSWIENLDIPLEVKCDLWLNSHSRETIKILINILENQDSDAQILAINILGSLGFVEVIPKLIDALRSKDSGIRWSAARALIQTNKLEAIPGLINSLKHQDPNVRHSAVTALGEIGNENAVSELIYALEDHNDDVRRSAADALGKLKLNKSIPALIEAFKNEDIDFCFRARIIDSLWEIGQAKSILDLLNFLESEGNFNTLHLPRIIELLGRIGDKVAVNKLLIFLENEDQSIRRVSAEALGKIGAISAVNVLCRKLRDPHKNIREKSAEALGKIGSKESMPELFFSLEDEESCVRVEAANALIKFECPEIIAKLFDVLAKASSSARSGAAYALGMLGRAEALSVLLENLQHHNRINSYRIMLALKKIGGIKVVTELLSVLKNSDDDVRWMAADVLGTLGFTEAVPGLLSALQDPCSRVRWNSAKALGKLSDVIAIPSLINALEDQNYIVRYQAAISLVHLDPCNVSSKLLHLLDDQDYLVRWRVAGVLGESGNPSLLAVLWKTHLQNPEEHFQEAICAIQNRCEFYNHGIRQEAVASQKAKLEIQNEYQAQTGQTNNVFPNAKEVKIFERVDRYYEHPPDANSESIK